MTGHHNIALPAWLSTLDALAQGASRVPDPQSCSKGRCVWRRGLGGAHLDLYRYKTAFLQADHPVCSRQRSGPARCNNSLDVFGAPFVAINWHLPPWRLGLALAPPHLFLFSEDHSITEAGFILRPLRQPGMSTPIKRRVGKAPDVSDILVQRVTPASLLNLRPLTRMDSL